MEQQQGEQPQQQQQPLVQVQPQPVPQKCPRCDSLNTKFCYYNNYSLSQPRYFCKTCRRYWTQGGTLRNVPVGGGCRKGKRPKTTSPSSSTSSENSQPTQKVVLNNHLFPTPSFYQGGGSGGAGAGVGVGVGVGVGGGGYLASLAALNHQLNHPHPSTNYPFDQSLINVGVGGSGCGSSSNMGLLQGFNAAAFLGSSSPSSSASQRQIPSQPFYQLGNGGGMELASRYNSEQGLMNIPSTMASNNNNNNYTTSAASMLQTQSFMNSAAANSNNMRALSDASLWSTLSTTYINGGGNTSASDNRTTSASAAAAAAGVGGSNSLVPNQWSDLQGFQPPPQ